MRHTTACFRVSREVFLLKMIKKKQNWSKSMRLEKMDLETEAIEFTITYINKQESGIEKGYSFLNLEMIPIFC